MEECVDIIVVGGGPVGLYALYYAGLRSMSSKVIEALPELGGQLWALYPDNDIVDMTGTPKIKAKDLVANLKQQALQYEPEVVTGERVVGLREAEGGFEVATEKARRLARTVLIATGPGALIPDSIFDQPVEEQRNRGLFIEPEDITQLADRDVLVCSGKEEAIGWAIDAATIARSVTVINWMEVYCADEARTDAAFHRLVDVMTPYELLEIHGKDRIEAATIIQRDTGETTRLKADIVLMARGQITNLEPIRAWGIKLERNGIAVDRKMQTSLPGVFAAGDIVIYPGKIKSIAAGVGEAATAVNNAKVCIEPSARMQPPYTADTSSEEE